MVSTLLAHAGAPGFVMKQEVTGLATNCYLVYDPKSRDAALIDVGGPIDSLLAHIVEQQLKVRYLLVTHGHPDHLIGLADLRTRFPRARVGMHEAAHRDMQLVQDWLIEQVASATDEEVAEHPELAKLVAFDVASFQKPDFFTNDGDTLALGGLSIVAIHTPGHAPGSICYLAGDMLFSGDTLFDGAVGRVDLPNSSAEALVSSIRRLYGELPDSTRVYPGHGEPTDIGSEKAENTEITLEKVDP
jgi:glyoxylase-like metal-dependent hydrolase (beta-lactamase superfamily II)